MAASTPKIVSLDVIVIPNKRTLALRGLVNILFGFLLFLWPGISAYIVVLLFSLNIIVVGLFVILEPMVDKTNKHAIVTVVLGVLGVAFGVYLIGRPEFAASIVGILIGIWAILFGVSDLILSARIAKEKVSHMWVFVIVGIISILFGIYMLITPITGILTLVWAIGLYAIITGVLLAIASLFVKSPSKQVKTKGSKK